MIRAIINASRMPLEDEDVALCQRVYYHACAARKITRRDAREDLAASIIDTYQHGVRDEGSLRRLFV